MAPFPSIATTLQELESLMLLMEISAIFPSIPLPRITNQGPTRHLHLYPGSGVLTISSKSSSRRFVYFIHDLAAS